VEPDLADLIPLFVGEVRGRLERLAGLCPRVESDPAAAAEARRELHTLKGAGRMLRLGAFAELCHAAEGLLQGARPDAIPLLTRATDRLSTMVDGVAAGETPVEDRDLLAALAGTPPAQGYSAVAPASPHQTFSEPLPAHTSSEVRIEASVLNALAEEATRLRILARGSERHVKRIHELVRLAEASMREPNAQQALAALATALRRTEVEAEATQRRLLHSAEQQVDGLLALQLQPLQGLLLALARHARELARGLGRDVEVEVFGGETRLDRRIIQDLEEALLHIVRNAVDHGIETPEKRAALGKPKAGSIRIEAMAAANRVRITIADDGAGIDPGKVVEAAVNAGVIEGPHAAALSRDEALRLLFRPGFSTRLEVTELSGRGVGLDAVASVAARAGGSVALDSLAGRGTTVVVEVPVARRGEEVVTLRVGAQRLALPSAVVQHVDRFAAGDVVEREGRTLVEIDGRLVPFVFLARLLGEEAAPFQFLLRGVHAGRPVAVSADAVEGSEEVLLIPPGRVLASNPLLDSVALLSSGQPVGVLSPEALSRDGGARKAEEPARPARPSRLKVLLVDDSLVTREMERRLLEDAGFDVAIAADGQEALAQLSGGRFDCLVTDVEMPGMDGYELTRHVRTVPALAHLPVVVVTTHDRPEERLKGLEAGADAYLAKQGLDARELVALVKRLGGS
jgi:chemotaxis protein histidine kinase CheA/CheY-like chemotaxis protein